jgi:hypothetical protein
MNSSVSIAVLSENLIQITTIIDDEKVINQCDRINTVWDMSEIPIPKPRFRLSGKQNYLYIKAISSDQGKEALHDMKNERVSQLINCFLDGYKAKIKEGKLLSFVNGIIEHPLIGRNHINFATIGITKKEMFDYFIEKGIIKI